MSYFRRVSPVIIQIFIAGSISSAIATWLIIRFYLQRRFLSTDQTVVSKNIQPVSSDETNHTIDKQQTHLPLTDISNEQFREEPALHTDTIEPAVLPLQETVEESEKENRAHEAPFSAASDPSYQHQRDANQFSITIASLQPENFEEKIIKETNEVSQDRCTFEEETRSITAINPSATPHPEKTTTAERSPEPILSEAYCVKCRQKRPIHNSHMVITRNGRSALEGTCPICKTKLFRFIARAKEENN